VRGIEGYVAVHDEFEGGELQWLPVELEFPSGAKMAFVSHRHRVQTGSGAHQPSIQCVPELLSRG
jgi:hypothetical protein